MYQRQSGKQLAKALRSIFQRRVFNLLRYGTFSAIEDINAEVSEDIIEPKRNNLFETRNDEEVRKTEKLKSVAGKLVLDKKISKKEEDILPRANLYQSKGNLLETETLKEKPDVAIPPEKLLRDMSRRIPKTIGPMINEEIKKVPKTRQALKIGDIVYFKYNPASVGMTVDDERNKQSMVVSGDGIASNKLECIQFNANGPKNGQFLSKKCFFVVETASKYNYAELLDKVTKQFQQENMKGGKLTPEQQDRLNKLRQKVNEEKKENELENEASKGQPVIYGREIQLRHKYSDTLLTLNSHKLSKQYGCVELGLEEIGSSLSNFKFLSNNNLRGKEDIVHYSDSLVLGCAKDPSMFVHVWSDDKPEKNNTFQTGLEINGSEVASVFKIDQYMSHEVIEEHEKFNETYLEAGDFVKIFHKRTNCVISVTSQEIAPALIAKNVIYINEHTEDTFQQRKTVEVKYLDVEKFSMSHQVALVEPTVASYYALWEVQRRDPFYSGYAMYDESFRLKNVPTGLFLCSDPDTNQLTLTPDGKNPACYFNFRLKSVDDSIGRIRYNELLRLQTSQDLYIQSTEGKPNEMKQLLCGPKSRDVTQLYFLLTLIKEDQTSTANRVSSLLPFLMQFYTFLQGWGLDTPAAKTRTEEFQTYTHIKALQTEKDLELETYQLKESLENIKDLLKTDDGVFSLKEKQNLLLEQKILEMLLLIAELIDVKIFGLKNRKSNEGRLVKIRGLESIEEHNAREGSAQAIASRYLKKVLPEIYDIITLAIHDNPNTVGEVLKHDTFLSGQLLHFRGEVGMLLKETMENAVHIGENDPTGEQIVEWIKLLETIKETDRNIELQITYLEIISLACIDSISKSGIPKYQDRVINEFYSPNSSPLLKSLVSFHLHKERNSGNSVYVCFGKDRKVSEADFVEGNPVLGKDGLGEKNEVKSISIHGKLYYSLEHLCKLGESVPEIDILLEYIVAALNLYYSLFHGRNKHALQKIEGLGLDYELVSHCIKSKEINLKVKKSFILLYEALFINVKPFQSISKNISRCYM